MICSDVNQITDAVKKDYQWKQTQVNTELQISNIMDVMSSHHSPAKQSTLSDLECVFDTMSETSRVNAGLLYISNVFDLSNSIYIKSLHCFCRQQKAKNLNKCQDFKPKFRCKRSL